MENHYLFFAVIGFVGLCLMIALSHLMRVVKTKYPKAYKEYAQWGAFITPMSKFYAEFVLGGMYKHIIEHGDYKYVKRVKTLSAIVILLFIGFIFFTFTYTPI